MSEFEARHLDFRAKAFKPCDAQKKGGYCTDIGKLTEWKGGTLGRTGTRADGGLFL